MLKTAPPTINKHTDNLKLSKNRAASVVEYLTQNRIKNHLASQGYGETQSVATNDTDEGRLLNRRVEFMVTSK